MIPQTSAEVISHADAVRIREVLGDVLQSAPFRTTRQCQSLLKYIVEHTLAGENDLLRERVIGTEVFGRSHDYEPGDDPVVRVRAAEVRKRLRQRFLDGPRGALPIYLLRDRVIGTEVFGRSHDYEPGDDPVVRVRAAEVRKRLAQYYQDRAGSLLRVDIRS